MSRIRIHIASDSTVATYGGRVLPMMGWGQLLYQYFDFDQVEIWNRAICGRSSRSFVEEGRLERMAQDFRPGDYLLIQFGHNDATKQRPQRYTEPGKPFAGWLQRYIDAARAKGVQPVLITPMQRRVFDAEEHFEWVLMDYIRTIRELAAAEQVPLLDLAAVSGPVIANMGPEESKKYFFFSEPGEEPNYPDGHQDDTHFQERGARLMVELVVGLMKESDLNLKKYIRPRQKPEVRVYMAGDSTMAQYGDPEQPMAGWGQMFWEYMQPTVEIRNHACCGRSSQSFIDEGRLARILREIRSGDYLFIQFAHNDEKLDYDNPVACFERNIRQFIAGARSRLAHPVLLTAVERRKFTDSGELQVTHSPFIEATREIARLEDVPLLDMNAASRRLLTELGPEAARQLFLQVQPGEEPNYPDGHMDDTHFSEYGARRMARLAAQLLADSPIGLRLMLR